MPLTALDPTAALILVDLQKGIVAQATVHPVAGVIQNAAALAEAFREHKRPVVLVHVDGAAPGRAEKKRSLSGMAADWTQLVPELNAQPGDHRVTKRTWGAFTHTDLETYLRGREVTQVVIGGVSTSAGVESTARAAHELGFHVTLALDAMTDADPDAHHNSVTRIFPRIGETGTTAEIIALLDGVTN